MQTELDKLYEQLVNAKTITDVIHISYQIEKLKQEYSNNQEQEK